MPFYGRRSYGRKSYGKKSYGSKRYGNYTRITPKRVVQIVKQVQEKEAEEKEQNIATTNQGLSLTDYTVAYGQGIASGTASNQRVGSEIKVMKNFSRFTISTTTDVDTSSYNTIRIIVWRPRERMPVQSGNLSDYTPLGQTGTALAVFDMYNAVADRTNFIIYHDKLFKLNNRLGQDSGTTDFIEDDRHMSIITSHRYGIDYKWVEAAFAHGQTSTDMETWPVYISFWSDSAIAPNPSLNGYHYTSYLDPA